MRIVGGTYTETCANPEFDFLAGSGMRAAATLTESGTDIALTTARRDLESQVADITAAGLGVRDVDWIHRSRSVGFSYFTPMGAPLISGAGAQLEQSISVEDDSVLVFGMIEAGRVEVHGKRVVLDPQRPRGLEDDDLPAIKADETVWTLNERETTQLASTTDVALGARALVEKHNLAAAVTKRGPRGALVTTRDGHQVEIGACRTSHVFPIGSGDVFAAAFAWAWAEQGADPVEAAKVGSSAAAHWCETMDYPTPIDVLQGKTTRQVIRPDTTSKVYLAGPFFNLQQRWVIDVVRDGLRPGVWSPFHEVGPGGIEVAKKDLAGLEQCDAVLALLDDDDPGTLFELGYATKMGLPIVGYAEHVHPEGRKMLTGTDAELYNDLSTAIYQAVWAAAVHANPSS